MKEGLVSGKVAWRRENARHHYVGSLWSCELDGIRLVGRDPATGIQVALTIPAEEIEGIRVSSGWDERLAGERCVIIELADTVPILLREVGLEPLEAGALADRIARLVSNGRTPVVTALEGGDSR